MRPTRPRRPDEQRKRENAEAEADEEQRKKADKQKSLWASSSSSSSPTSFDMSKLEVGEFRPKHARFAAFKETALKPVRLKKLRIRSVYTPRLTDPVTSGRAYLYFYPLGQTEPAIITLSDDSGENVYSLVVHPITGRVQIFNREIRPNLGVRYDDEGHLVTP